MNVESLSILHVLLLGLHERLRRNPHLTIATKETIQTSVSANVRRGAMVIQSILLLGTAANRGKAEKTMTCTPQLDS